MVLLALLLAIDAVLHDGINWADPDRRALVALAASYGQTVVPKPAP